jgi:hypothetical protein
LETFSYNESSRREELRRLSSVIEAVEKVNLPETVELEENATSQDAQYPTISCWGGIKRDSPETTA